MNYEDDLISRIRALSRPLEPVATGIAPRLRRIDGVKAVLFDVYGTLLVSAADSEHNGPLGDRIRQEHARLKAAGVAFPEVEIRDIWKAVKPDLKHADDVERWAVEYECNAHPTWPMPGAADTLSTLEARGIATGVVSNAQFYSPLAIQALMGRPLPEPAVWSFELGEAKPSPRLFRIALDDLAGRGIRPGEVLCIGNDMAKDILPAAALGCRTALFAGDQRSYRPGTWQAPVVPPDAVLTDLRQITTDLLTE